jgi:hypothetical protein
MSDAKSKRTEKLQIMLNDEELDAIDNWRFKFRLPSRAAAIRELIFRGLGADLPNPSLEKSSGEFSVVDSSDEH